MTNLGVELSSIMDAVNARQGVVVDVGQNEIPMHQMGRVKAKQFSPQELWLEEEFIGSGAHFF